MRITFNLKYLLLTVLLFFTELGIAMYINDAIIRPFGGDVLVVVLIYCFFRIFLSVDYWKVALGTLLFAFLIEILQYFRYVKLLGLEHNRILSTAMGDTFQWTDFVAYFAGFLLIILGEEFYQRYKKKQAT